MPWKDTCPQRLIPTPIPVDRLRKQVSIQESRKRFSSRKVEFAVKFGGYVLGGIWRGIRGKKTPEDEAVRLRMLFESMGALWIKVGQLISLRSDVLSQPMCEELSKLQFRSVGFPWAQAKQTIEADLKRPIEEVFESIEEIPMAAASICQVHRAKLRAGGADVIVKVQRPYVEEDLSRDLHILEILIGIFKGFGALSYLRWDSLLWELKQILLEEVDYRFEASNQRRMRKMLHKQLVYVPKLFDHLCTKRVLVMEFVPGALMSDYLDLYRNDPAKLREWLAENEIDKSKVGVRLFLCFFRQLMEENFFHADLHPGNILLLKNSRFCLIDFGSAGSIEANLLRIYTMSLTALGEGDYRRAVDYTMLMCEDLPSTGLDDAKAEMVRAYREWTAKAALAGVDYHEKSIAAAGTASGRVMGKYKIAASWQFLKISRTWVTLDSSLAYLLDDSNFIKLIHQYFKDRQKRQRKEKKKGPTGMEAILGGLGEMVLLQGGNLRRQTQRFSEAAGKAASVAAISFTGMRHALMALMILLLIGELRAEIPVPGIVVSLLELVEHHWPIGTSGWFVVLGVMAFVWLRLGRIVRGLLTREV
jgi:ubiquinone biosynthesis protein